MSMRFYFMRIFCVCSVFCAGLCVCVFGVCVSSTEDNTVDKGYFVAQYLLICDLYIFFEDVWISCVSSTEDNTLDKEYFVSVYLLICDS